MRIFQLARRYPWVVATLIVGALTGLLLLAGWPQGAAWLASGWVILTVISTTIGMCKDMLAGHWGLDILAVVAMIATVAVGEYLAGLIIVLMLTGGEALEDYAAARAGRELDALLDRAPAHANLITGDVITQIPAEQVAVGDQLLIKPAEVLPVDGVIVQTENGADVTVDLDESALTGESLPVSRQAGQRVLSGTVNGQRAFRMRAEARAADSQFAAIIALVKQAVDSKAPLVRLADRYAVPFTIVSLLLAGLAWWLSKDPARFAEVLVVATPCPLLIAAPVAFMGGMSRAAKAGVIVKDATVIELLSRLKAAAFDKTGTLTRGHPDIVAIEPVGIAQEELLALAAAAEQYSTHVFAECIVQAAAGLELPAVHAAEEIATNGVRAQLADGREVLVGKPSFIDAATGDTHRVPLTAGRSAVYVAVDNSYLGALIVADPLRPEARDTIARLRTLGVQRITMLTGDVSATATAIAHRVGIDDVEAECTPQSKVADLAAMHPRPVLMVGDGVNDAPVLAAADVGIAMGARGSTAASQSAGAVITADDLSAVTTVVQISQRTVRIAVQSIWLGIIISVALMLIAACGFLPAVAGALLQELVDLAAILGSLRALRPGPAEVGARHGAPVSPS